MLLTAHLSGVALMTALALLGAGGSLTSGQLLATIALGPLSVVAFLCLLSGLRRGPLAIVSPIVNASALVTVLCALVLLAEPMQSHQLVGAAIVLTGVLLASTRLTAAARRAAGIGRGVLFAFGAMLGIGLYNFFLGDLAQDAGWFMPLYVSRAVGVVLMIGLAAGPFGWPWRRLDRRGLALAALVPGVLSMLGSFAFNRGAELGLISLTAAGASVYPLIPIAAGVLIFRERIAAPQWFGLLAIIAGLIALSVGG